MTSVASDQASSGITGLDQFLAGGFPVRRMHLIEGVPGTGKTTLAQQFLLAAKARGERTLYVTLSETTEELAAVAASHGWSLDGIIDTHQLAPVSNRDAILQADLDWGARSEGRRRRPFGRAVHGTGTKRADEIGVE
jgi:KaiC/GvpD/RAD55 family RecA-like ATPase